jgi:predicted DNA-binding transcriptional regulator AlpA
MCGRVNLMNTHTDFLGLSEIAELYGVHRNTANNWSRQRDFPLPIAQLKMGPLWRREDVVAWKRPAHFPRPGDSQYLNVLCAWCGSDSVGETHQIEQTDGLPRYEFLGTCEKCSKQTWMHLYFNYAQTSLQTRQYPFDVSSNTKPKEA